MKSLLIAGLIALSISIAPSCRRAVEVSIAKDSSPRPDPDPRRATPGTAQAQSPAVPSLADGGTPAAGEVFSALEKVRWESLRETRRSDSPSPEWRLLIEGEWRLVQDGRPAVPALTAALSHGNAEVRLLAARALGRIGDQDSVEPIARALEGEKDPCVRIGLAESLGLLGGDRAKAALTRALAGLPSPTAMPDFYRELETSLSLLGAVDRGQLLREYGLADPRLLDTAEAGRPAPDLVLPDAQGAPVRLSGLWSKETVVLLFLVARECDYCKDQLQNIGTLLDRIASARARIVGISRQVPERLRAWQEALDPRILLLSDPAERAQAIFGIARQLFMHYQWYPSPTCAIVDRSGIIRFLYRGKAYNDRVRGQRILGEILSMDRR